MFEQAFKNIDDVLWKEAGCTTELDYTEQTSWLLFLKYLDGLEQDKAAEAALEGKKYSYILDKKHRWEEWAAPKGKDGQIDHNRALTGDDLREFVDDDLFPYLTPFRVRQIATTLDEYVYTPDDTLVEGQVEAGRRYTEPDFNWLIEIKEREKKRVEISMSQIDQREKTLVFCATQEHALAVRDLINQMKASTDPNYCVRVTANDGALGDQHLRLSGQTRRRYRPSSPLRRSFPPAWTRVMSVTSCCCGRSTP